MEKVKSENIKDSTEPNLEVIRSGAAKTMTKQDCISGRGQVSKFPKLESGQDWQMQGLERLESGKGY